MILSDYHVHTTFCDGKNSPEEVVQKAIEKGLTELGFSGHSHTAFDESWCMSLEGTEQYRKEIQRLKNAYASQIRILCGIEQDFYSEMPTDGYDYVIGSVHYILADGVYLPVDESPEDLKKAAEDHFGGDFLSLCECYFETVGQVAEKTKCDIIGHLDLVTKFNEAHPWIDTQHPRYIAAWKKAVDRLLKAGVPFEVNTGAISRGYRTEPYPSRSIRDYIRDNGGSLILSGDTHQAENLCFQFDQWTEAGIRSFET